ncbi:MAG TPA: hypothetical protein VN688_11485 [Gemmataceae bacterium]|nr:hypothetical protein [Gemmataceae bacterium]
MKKIFGVALLALPFLAVSAQANGWPFNVQAGGSFYIKGGPGPAYPQAGPWYLYWPLEAHFVAPAPTGYPYWPGPQVLPKMSIGGPAVPPAPAYVPPPAVVPVPAAPAAAAAGPALQPTNYSPTQYTRQIPNYYPILYTGQAPSYWYDR